MELFLLYFALMVMGYILGDRLKKREKTFKCSGILQLVMVIALIFIMGARLMVNKKIVESLDSIGLTSFALTIFIMGGSIIGIMVARKMLEMDRKGEAKGDD